MDRMDCEYWQPIDDPDWLWYTYPVQDRLKIYKMISEYLDKYPISGDLKQNVDKPQMIGYIMKELKGHYNPKIVENIINFFFKDN